MRSQTRSPSTVVDDATVGLDAWTAPASAKLSDDAWASSYTISGEASHYLKATDFGFTIPPNSVVKGIVARIEKHDTVEGYSYRDTYVNIVKGGAFGSENKADTGTDWPHADAYFAYGDGADLWSETWLPGEINAADFGVAVAAGPDGAVAACYVDHMELTVYYEGGGGRDDREQAAIITETDGTVKGRIHG